MVAGDPLRGARSIDPQAMAHRVHRSRDDVGEAKAYVGLVTRAIAFAVDAALINVAALAVGVVVALIFSVLPVSGDFESVLIAAGGVLFAAWGVVYFATFWTSTGVTPGNRAMRIQVVRVDGSMLRPRHALIRLVGIVLSLPLLWGFVPILFNDRRRGLHDKLAGTVVVTTQRDGAPTG